jgi:high-affinity Fe2+/Pb2+ permease
MTINYQGSGTIEERLQRLESRARNATLTIWTGVLAIILGAMLFTAGLWALGRAGMF